MNVTEIPVGTVLMEESLQFGVTNKIIKTRDDSTGLGRDIAYFRYVGRLWEREFAIWQFEVGSTIILKPI